MHKQQRRQKKGDTTSDVLMGSYDGAVSSFPNCRIELYRDDGLAMSNITLRDRENIKKEICRISNHRWLRITIEAKTTLQYVYRESNHPPPTTHHPHFPEDHKLRKIFDAIATQSRSVTAASITLSNRSNKLATADRRTHAHLTETASSHLSSTESPSHARTTAPLKHTSFRYTKLRNYTELSKHIWTLKESNINHYIS